MALPDLPINTPMLDEGGFVTRQWRDWFIAVRDITGESAVSDATTAHSITDPADAPASADALRDDLVLNTIPSVESALNALGTKVNSVITALEGAGIIDS